MSAPRHDEPWIDRATALLDRTTDDLDAATLSRLNRARHAALSQRRTAPRWAWPAGFAAAAAAVFALAIGLHRPGVVPVDASSASTDDIDALVGDDDVDLAENLDFYAWLETQPGDSNG